MSKKTRIMAIILVVIMILSFVSSLIMPFV